MDGQECRDVPAVEQADMAQVDGLLEQHRWGDHLPRDEVPGVPHVLPLLDRREGERRPRDRAVGRVPRR